MDLTTVPAIQADAIMRLLIKGWTLSEWSFSTLYGDGAIMHRDWCVECVVLADGSILSIWDFDAT